MATERAHGVGQHNRRVVSRAVVDDHDLQLLVLACQRRQRSEGSLRADGIVVNGNDDGDVRLDGRVRHQARRSYCFGVGSIVRPIRPR